MPAAITVKLDSLSLSDEQFYQLCLTNRELRFERNCQGDLVIMSPTGGETSNRKGILILWLGLWAERDGTGIFSILLGASNYPMEPTDRQMQPG